MTRRTSTCMYKNRVHDAQMRAMMMITSEKKTTATLKQNIRGKSCCKRKIDKRWLANIQKSFIIWIIYIFCSFYVYRYYLYFICCLFGPMPRLRELSPLFSSHSSSWFQRKKNEAKKARKLIGYARGNEKNCTKRNHRMVYENTRENNFEREK